MAEKDTIQNIREKVKNRFEVSKRVLTFDEFFQFAELKPHQTLRDSAHYLYDAIQSFGSYDVTERGRTQRRYRIFDQDFQQPPQPVIGQESVQNRLVQVLTSFVRSGRSNKLVVLHGPNGSSKSSFLRALFAGLEQYSKSDEGWLFQFSWVFPHDSDEKSTLGIHGKSRDTNEAFEGSYAKLDQDKIGCIVRSDLNENPIFLLPKEERAAIFERWLAIAPDREAMLSLKNHFLEGELSQKNMLIFEALLKNYQGDFKKILRHVRVERLYMSKRFRRGLVTVEPQFGVDASIRQVTLDRSLANLPPALQSLNLFQLEGDLIDGNRGVVEYNDFLKRPLEHFKYLLGTCETGTVNLANVVAFLDSVFIATTDEKHLEAFREHPEYGSFKARLELIKMPYLLRYSKEAEIYKDVLKSAAGPKEVMPHTTEALALWAVLTRLKRPFIKNKNSVITRVLENLTPLAKAKLYDSGELPEKLSDEERRELRGHLEEMYEEQQNQPYYEGLLGASARELKVILQVAAQSDQYPTLGPNAVITEIRKLIKRPMDFEYLRLEPNHGYHEFEEFVETTKREWLNWVDREVRTVLDLNDEKQFHDQLARYVAQISAHIRGERMKNQFTGLDEKVDEQRMREFEELIGVKADFEDYRKNLISRLGAWSMEHPDLAKVKPLPFTSIFPDLLEKLQDKSHQDQVEKLRLMAEVVVDSDGLSHIEGKSTPTEAEAMALKAYKGLQRQFGYGAAGAKEALIELIKSRYMHS